MLLWQRQEKERLRHQMENRLATMRAGLKRRLQEMRNERAGAGVGGTDGGAMAHGRQRRQQRVAREDDAGEVGDAPSTVGRQQQQRRQQQEEGEGSKGGER